MVSTLRELGRRVRLADPRPDRRRLRAQRRERRAAGRARHRAAAHGRLRDHRGRGGARWRSELGIEVDRHRPPPGRRRAAGLPDPAPGARAAIRSTQLCGTAVAWKLASARCGRRIAGAAPSADLDLVALATVADVVPLVGENRSLVKRGLAEMRRARRPGLRALMAAAKCEPTRLDEGDLGVPAGAADQCGGAAVPGRRGGRAVADRGRGAGGGDRDGAEPGQRRAAGDRARGRRPRPRRRCASCRSELREAPGLVVAGEGWHPGVIGIVASRLVERHHRPVVVDLARRRGRRARLGAQHPRLRPARGARGLLRAPGAASAGTGPPPGSRCEAENLDAFREAFAAHADRGARPRGPAADRADRRDGRRRRPRPRPGRGAAAAGAVRDGQPGRAAAGPLGAGPRRADDGRRASTPASASTAAPTGRSASPSAAPASGSSEDDRSTPRCGSRSTTGTARSSRGSSCASSTRSRTPRREPRRARLRVRGREWWQRFEAELARDPAPAADAVERLADGRQSTRRARDRSPASAPATVAIAELVSSGAGVLAVCADASRRAALAAAPPGSPASTAAPAAIACHRCGGDGARRPRRPGRGRPGADRLRDARARDPELAAALRARRPRRPAAVAAPTSCSPRARREPAASGGYLHRALGRGRAALRARRRSTSSCASREAVAGVFRDLREAGEGERRPSCARRSPAAAPHPLAPEAAARCFRVLARARPGRRGAPDGGDGVVGVVSSEGPIWSARPRSAPTAPDHRRHRNTSKDPNSRRAQRAPRRPLRRGRGVRLRAERRRRQRRRRRHRGRGGDDRPRRGRARLRLRLRPPRRPAALLRRRVHHPPGRGRPDLRRHAARHRDPLRGAAPRHGRGHQRQPRGDPRRSSARRSPSWSTASPS